MQIHPQKVRPKKKWVLLKIEPANRVYGVLVLPESVSDELGTWLGEVVAVGPECSVSPGQKVVFRAYLKEVVSFEHEGSKYALIKDDDLMAVVPKETKLISGGRYE